MRRVAAGVGQLLALLLLAGSAAAAAADFDYQALRDLIDHDHIDSIETLLAALPAPMRSHYVLVFASRSLQQASLRDPRVILYGAEAHLMLSFNGDPGEAGYDAVETAEYEPRQARFRFREIRFLQSPTGPTVQYSLPDPQRCTQCHGDPARPVWDASPLWPGAYGEQYRANLGSVERVGLQRFLAQQPTHPRYRLMLDAQRLAQRGAFAPDAMLQYSGGQAEPPNAEFSLLLARMNAQRVARELREQDQYGAYRYALLGAAEGDCGSLAEFLPVPDSLQVQQRRFRQAADAARAAQDEAKQLRALPRTWGLRSLGRTGAGDSRLDAVRFLTQSRLGVSTQDWTLALEKDAHDSDPHDAQLLASALRADLAQSDLNIVPLHAAREGSTVDRYCAYLQERSRSTLSRVPGGGSPTTVRDEAAGDTHAALQATVQHCASCHVGGAAPELPFGQPQALARLLDHGAYPHGHLVDEIMFRLSPQAAGGHMPPDMNISVAQREVLSIYLTSLAPNCCKAAPVAATPYP